MVHNKEKGGGGSSSRPAPSAQLNKPAPTLAPIAPTAPSYSNAFPPVTRVLGGNPFYDQVIQYLPTPQDIDTLTEVQAVYWVEDFHRMCTITKPGDESRLLEYILARYTYLVDRLNGEGSAMDLIFWAGRKRRRQ